LGIDVLARHDLHRSIESHRPVHLIQSELIAPDGSVATIELPRAMWGISRSVLDAILLRIAREAGVTVLQPAICEAVNANRVTCRDLESNQSCEIDSQYVVVADGKAACGLPHRTATSDLGVKAHFVGVDSPRDTISLFGLRGHYVGLAAIEEGRWNVAMS